MPLWYARSSVYLGATVEKAIKAILDALEVVEDNIPDGYYKHIAMTKLQEAALWVGKDLVLKRKTGE